MATYYVRQSGSDSNNGTSPATAWRTIGKALGGSGAANGDVVYVGAGTYYESVACNAAANGATVIGDTRGEHTGELPGEIILTPYDSPYSRSSSSIPLNFSTADNITVEGISIYGGSGFAVSCDAGGTGNTVRKCLIVSQASNALNVICAFGAASNFVAEDCYIFGGGNGSFGIQIQLTRGAGADYDSGIQIRRCVSLATSRALRILSTGAGVNFGGGVDIVQSTFLALCDTADANISTSIPNTVQDCVVFGGFAAAASGQISDLGGNLVAGPMTNVTVHATSRASNSQVLQALSLGHEGLYGLPAQRAFSLKPGFGASGVEGAQTHDAGEFGSVIDGSSLYGESGTCTSANNDDLSDSGKAWGVNQWKGWLLRITGGTGAGQVKRVNANTATELDISGATPSGGLWATTPDATSTYIIYQGPPVETGKATSGSDTTIVDSGANWATNQWAGYTVAIGAESQTVISNTSTTLTTASWTTDPTTNDLYSIYKDSLTAVQAAPGALAAHDTGRPLETVSGSQRLPIDGYGSQMFEVPVLAQPTTLSVRARYDSNHGTGTKPQLILLAQGDLDVATETITMSSGADTDETLTLTEFTPSAVGIVRVIVQSRSSTPYGRAFFDELTRSY